MSEADLTVFAQVVEERFEAILGLGFRLIPTADAVVVGYESPVVFVNVYKLEMEHSASLRIGLLDHPTDAITDAELLALAGLATSRTSVTWREAVSEFAAELFQYGGLVLEGDPNEFARVKDIRRRYTAQYM